jgi:hypothetical protein
MRVPSSGNTLTSGMPRPPAPTTSIFYAVAGKTAIMAAASRNNIFFIVGLIFVNIMID